MSPWSVAGLLAGLLLYIALLIFAIKKKRDTDNVTAIIHITDRDSKTFIFDFERRLIEKANITPEKANKFLWIERIAILVVVVFLLISIRGLALGLVGAIFMMILFDDLYKRALYRSGITNIPNVTNFINFFVPHLVSGNGAEQSMLEYITKTENEELAEYFDNINNPDYKLKPHLRQIIDIYDIAIYNEQLGHNDYTYIMNQISDDIAQKQTYYNGFIARIGEIKPICWSYYIGVPVLILVSYENTYTFWQSGWGWVIALVLLGFFSLFKYLIYKLQKKTIETIF